MSSIDISTTVGKSLSDAFDVIINENGGPDTLQGIQTVMSWYDQKKPIFDNLSQNEIDKIPDAASVLNLAYEATKGRDVFLSTLSNIVVQKIMNQVSVPFVNVMISEIKIKTKGKTKSVPFNLTFAKSLLKPYIEFIMKVNGMEVKSVKLVFEIDINATMQEITFEYEKGSSTIKLGNLQIDLTVSIKFTIPVTRIQESKCLGNKKLFDIDLSKFHITL